MLPTYSRVKTRVLRPASSFPGSLPFYLFPVSSSRVLDGCDVKRTSFLNAMQPNARSQRGGRTGSRASAKLESSPQDESAYPRFAHV